MIRAMGVHKTYGQGDGAVRALRGLDLEIDEAGFFAIMGPSGSGKTTLLHLLAGLDRPDGGEIHVAGKRIDTLSERELTMFRREDVGIVFQQFNLIPTMTALQNVELPGVLAKRDGAWLRSRASGLLERLGVDDRAAHRPDAMSGGEQQRVAIARAMLFEPRVILADEPTGNLDSDSSRALWGLLAELSRERGMSVVMVTHEPAAATHCSRVFAVQDGVCTGSFATESLDESGVAAEYQRAVGA